MPWHSRPIAVCNSCGGHCSARDGRIQCDSLCTSTHSDYDPEPSDVVLCCDCWERYENAQITSMGYGNPRAATPLTGSPLARHNVQIWLQAAAEAAPLRNAWSAALLLQVHINGEQLLTQGFEPDFRLMPPAGLQLHQFDRRGRDPRSTTDWDTRDAHQGRGNWAANGNAASTVPHAAPSPDWPRPYITRQRWNTYDQTVDYRPTSLYHPMQPTPGHRMPPDLQPELPRQPEPPRQSLQPLPPHFPLPPSVRLELLHQPEPPCIRPELVHQQMLMIQQDIPIDPQLLLIDLEAQSQPELLRLPEPPSRFQHLPQHLRLTKVDPLVTGITERSYGNRPRPLQPLQPLLPQLPPLLLPEDEHDKVSLDEQQLGERQQPEQFQESQQLEQPEEQQQPQLPQQPPQSMDEYPPTPTGDCIVVNTSTPPPQPPQLPQPPTDEYPPTPTGDCIVVNAGTPPPQPSQLPYPQATDEHPPTPTEDCIVVNTGTPPPPQPQALQPLQPQLPLLPQPQLPQPQLPQQPPPPPRPQHAQLPQQPQQPQQQESPQMAEQQPQQQEQPPLPDQSEQPLQPTTSSYLPTTGYGLIINNRRELQMRQQSQLQEQERQQQQPIQRPAYYQSTIRYRRRGFYIEEDGYQHEPESLEEESEYSFFDEPDGHEDDQDSVGYSSSSGQYTASEEQPSEDEPSE